MPSEAQDETIQGPARSRSATALPELRPLYACMETLTTLLRKERAAIVRLDAQAIEDMAQAKSELSERLQRLLQDVKAAGHLNGTSPAQVESRILVEQTGRRIAAVADANRILMNDALRVIAEVRGIVRSAGTYDARARVTDYAGGRRVGRAL